MLFLVAGGGEQSSWTDRHGIGVQAKLRLWLDETLDCSYELIKSSS